MLRMLERNKAIKTAPQKWQDCAVSFHLIIAFDLRVYETIVDGILFYV